MKQLTRKLFISIFAIVFAVVALGTTSYAWFTLGNKAGVSGIDATIKAGDGLEIAIGTAATDLTTMNALTWTNTIDYVTPDTVKLEAVSMTAANTFKKLDIDGAAPVYSATDPEADKDYVKFTLNFRVKAAEGTTAGKVLLTGANVTAIDNTFTADTAYKLVGDNEVEVTKDNSVTVNAAYASRLMVGSTIYETAASTGDIAIGAAYNHKGLQAANATDGAANYFEKKSGKVLDAVSVPESYDADTETQNYAAALATEQELFDIAGKTQVGGYYLGSVDVYLWIEGWDAECYNAIFAQSISALLQLEFRA